MACELCSGTKHIQKGNKWERCICLIREDWKEYLGPLAMIKGERNANMEANHLIAFFGGTQEEFYVGLKWYLLKNRQSYSILDAYKLVDLFLKNENASEGISGMDPLFEPTLLVMVLDNRLLPNKMLPHLVRRVLEGRRLSNNKKTWLVSPYGINSVALRLSPNDPDFVSYFNYLFKDNFYQISATRKKQAKDFL